MPIGYVSYINIKKNYGFIDSPELELEQIFFHITNCSEDYRHIHKGDKVSFEFDPLTTHQCGAKQISFIKNASLDGLKDDFTSGKILKGYLKKIDDRFYVKDRDTYILIPLMIASFEIDLEEVYEANLNSMIEYKITIFTAKNKIRAIKLHRHFLPNCKLLIQGNKSEGQIMSILKDGYQIKIFENILGFLPKSFAHKSDSILEVGDIVNVTCINVGDDLENVLFDLTENIQREIDFNIKKEVFFNAIKLGEKYVGRVENVQGFGVFVSFGLVEGLLHVNEIVGHAVELSKFERKIFSNMLEKTFIKGCEIEVIINSRKGNKIAVRWDKEAQLNRFLYNSIYKSYCTLKGQLRDDF